MKGMKYKTVEGVKEKDDVKYKVEQNASAKTGEGSPKQAKDNIQTSEPPKEDYIHVRARRGQATNSHSLAERVSVPVVFNFCRMIHYVCVYASSCLDV